MIISYIFRFTSKNVSLFLNLWKFNCLNYVYNFTIVLVIFELSCITYKQVDKDGPAYNATLRQCDNATISDITGVFTSPYIFNKMRRGATGKNPIKCDTTLRMRSNSIKCDNLIFTATVSIFEDLKLLGKILQKDLNKINESAWCLHSHLLHWNQCHCQRNWHKPIII